LLHHGKGHDHLDIFAWLDGFCDASTALSAVRGESLAAFCARHAFGKPWGRAIAQWASAQNHQSTLGWLQRQAKSSPYTALRDISDPVTRSALVKDEAGGRSTGCSLAE
jgi:hypothetical protein